MMTTLYPKQIEFWFLYSLGCLKLPRCITRKTSKFTNYHTTSVIEPIILGYPNWAWRNTIWVSNEMWIFMSFCQTIIIFTDKHLQRWLRCHLSHLHPISECFDCSTDSPLNSSFLKMHTLGGSRWQPSSWMLVPHRGDLNWVVPSWLLPDPGYCGSVRGL